MMGRMDEHDARRELETWLAGRPSAIRRMAERWPPWTCYRSTAHPRMHYIIMSYGDDGTMRLVHGMDSTLPGFTTFGQDPAQLVACGCGQFAGPPDLLDTRDALEAENGVMPAADCPHVGSGGWHSEAYLDGDAPCAWCGQPPGARADG